MPAGDRLLVRLGAFTINRFEAGEPSGYPTLCKGRFKARGRPSYLFEDPVSLDARPLIPALAAAKPKARPEAISAAAAAARTDLAATTPEAEPVAEPVAEDVAQTELAVTEPETVVPAVEAVPELVVTDVGKEASAADDSALAETATELTAVETVSGAAVMLPPDTQLATAAAPRTAPIFDSPTQNAVAEDAEEQEVVVVMSTSGGRHWGVNVGNYTSRYEAERALLKTALAESATLNQGLRKITQKGGNWHANFMGLTEEEADLACRRLAARAITCETVGP
ncbi:MAG: hypothetical protein HC844_05955 [Tabrizicola sp.]|nr:hypothetical protein [Tabrizicola sp.]